MNTRQRELYKKTRETRSLLMVFIPILALGLGVALVLNAFNSRPGLGLGSRYLSAVYQEDPEEAAEIIKDAMAEADGDPATIVENVRIFADVGRVLKSMEEMSQRFGMKRDRTERIRKFLASQEEIPIETWTSDAKLRMLCALYFQVKLRPLGIARSAPTLGEVAEFGQSSELAMPLRELYADIIFESGDQSVARFVYLKVLEDHPESRHSRMRLVMIALETQDTDLLESLLEDSPEGEGSETGSDEISQEEDDWFDTTTKILIYADQGEWGKLFLICFRYVYEEMVRGRWGLALLAGGIWFVVLLKGAGFLNWRERRGTILLSLAAVFLGILSIAPTFWAIYWQQEVWGIRDGNKIVDGAVFYIGGVGLREEFCKLLLFVPLAPILVKRGNNMEMLVVASFVGLGFAIEENVGYLARAEPGTTVIGRFLTANFAHMFLTGMIGYAFCKMWQNPRKWCDHFIFVFVFLVILHGVYDLFLSFDKYSDAEALNKVMAFPFVAFIIFLVYSKQYFEQFASLRDDSIREVISPLFYFVVGLGVLFALAYNYTTMLTGPYDAFRATGRTAFQLSPVAYFFYKCFQKH